MAMDTCGHCLRYTFGFINLALFVGGGALLAIGVLALVGDTSQLDQLDLQLYKAVAIAISAAGGVILVVSFLGCCGAFQQSRCLLGLFSCGATVMLIVVAGGAAAGFVLSRHAVLDSVTESMQTSLATYKESESARRTWDFLQASFRCCGVSGPADWTAVLGPTVVPQSCCQKTDDGRATVCASFVSAYRTGCSQRLRQLFEKHGALLGGVACGVAGFLLVSIIMSCVLIKSIGYMAVPQQVPMYSM